MKTSRLAKSLVSILLLAALGLAGCTTVISETAKKAWEDRSTADQATDLKIGAGIVERLTDRDAGLLIDLSSDVWEGRVMLTGTLDSANEKRTVERLVRTDKRIRRLYSHIKIVSKETKEKRREEVKKKDSEEKSGGVGQTVSDFWIETKIKAQLLTASGVTSVNYRWRSVFNDVYVIGRAGGAAERDKVLKILRETEGVKSVRQHIEIKPVKK